jgi:hypothetical protein
MNHMHSNTKLVAFLAALLATLLFGIPAFAQDRLSTPTTAPSKTATPTPAAATPEAVSTPSGGFQALTQSDLSVLTANVQRPNGLLWYNDFLYSACTGDTTVYEINAQTGQTRAYIAGVQNAHTFYAEGSGSSFALWTPDFGNNRLSLVTRTSLTPIAEGLNGPWGISYLDEEHFLITNLLGNSLVSVSRDGEVETILDDLAAPAGIVRDENIVYIANNGSTRRAIEWYDLSAPNDDSQNHVLVSGLQNTTGLQLASDGYLYFTYAIGTRGVVGRIQPQTCLDGGCTNEQIEVVVFTELQAPLAGLTITPDMRLYVHTMFVPDLYSAQLPNPSATEATEEAG